MRWKLVCGFAFAGTVAGTAAGQFAIDRVPPPPAPGVTAPPAAPPVMPAPGAPGLPPGFQPAAPSAPGAPPSTGAYTPPVGGVAPVSALSPSNPFVPPLDPTARTLTPPPRVEVESALGPNHEWAIKPEHGPFFILVKTYARPHIPTPEDNGPSARALAEALAGQIRELHHVQAFLFEYISEDRKAEAAAIAAERERGQQFLQQLKERQKLSELQGAVWMEPDNRIRYKTVNYRDQIAVMVGGFQTDLDARKALDIVHKWPAPKQTILMDGAVVSNLAADGKNARIENGYLNPYMSATVVPNPTIQQKGQQVPNHLEPFIVKLNEDRPYSLLKAKKDWTLAVKSFNAPVQIVSKDTDTSLMKDQKSNKSMNALLAGFVQAEAMAKMLREMKGADGQPLGLEAFVLHTRFSSIVTVGQFNGPDDPALLRTQDLLTKLKLNVSEDKTGFKPVGNAPTLFEKQLVPIQVPRP